MKDYILFNPEVKNRFLNESDYNVNTKQVIAQMFNITSETEKFYNKDIYEMSDSEIGEVLDNFNATSYETIYSKTSYLIQYVDWCIKEGYLSTNINNARLYLGKENIEKYVKKSAEKYKYLDKERFDYVIDFCNNAQDAAIFALLYEGARGRQIKEHALEELRNLKWGDCNPETNTVVLTRDDGEQSSLEVSTKTMEILKDANNQERYLKNNGEMSDWFQARKNTELELHKTEYILKPTIQGFYGKISAQNILQRIKIIKNTYGNNPYISVTNICRSGMIEYAKQLKEANGGKITKEDYIEVCRRFGVEEKYWVKTKIRIEKYL
jgi:integrase